MTISQGASPTGLSGMLGGGNATVVSNNTVTVQGNGTAVGNLGGIGNGTSIALNGTAMGKERKKRIGVTRRSLRAEKVRFYDGGI